ncbi:hypothetical protein TRIP_B250199 [uncultured Desulfatiglans sp.]|uniref:Uncharacterized protein n=1 Tax=Uncultured Desulfatiglans sp. TaxID=1748965 RepID=A0A653A561_UNCDX|nr:hypothetical protein TRIP_B250199 [uncultured Desulfatiglans sp.]
MISRYEPLSHPEMRIFANTEEIERLHGGNLQVAAQANVQTDAEMGQKDHFRMGTFIFGDRPAVVNCKKNGGASPAFR